MFRRIKLAFQVTVVLAVALANTVPVFSESVSLTQEPTLIISEVKVRKDVDGYDEYIELYNASSNAVVLSEYELQYFNSTNPSSGQQPISAPVNSDSQNVLPPGKFFVLAKDSSQIQASLASPFTSLSDTAGRLKLVDPSGAVISEAAWTSSSSQAVPPVVLVTSSNAVGKSITRSNDNSGAPMAEGTLTLAQVSPHSDALEMLPVDEPSEDNPSDDEQTPVYLSVVLSEFFIDPVSPQTDGDDEFVELFNPYEHALDLDGYVIKTGSNLQYSYIINGVVLQPGEYWAFYSSEGNITLANSGGQVQVCDPDGNPVSNVAKYEEAEAGKSWSKVGDLWQWTSNVTPASINIADAISDISSGTYSGTVPGLSGAKVYPILSITELLVDPAAPALDSQDEYVELYNPNPQPVSLKGYVLRTGSSLKTKYSLPETLIQPGHYMAIYGKDANISLSNNGGSARLDDVNENIIAEANNYEKAEVGDSWALIENTWQWTSTPTPNAPNVFSISAKETKKSKAAFVAKNAKGTKAAQTKALDAITKPATVPASPLSIGIIATTTGLALLYGLYEFRYDFFNRLELFRRYVRNRWHSGP